MADQKPIAHAPLLALVLHREGCWACIEHLTCPTAERLTKEARDARV